jgi:hypothetical protein
MKQIGAFLLLTSLLLAGCAGKDAPGDVLSDPTLTTETSVAPPSPTEDPNEFVPKFHTHDYWAGRPDMVLYAGDVAIGEDALGETAITNAGIIIGTTTFDTKADGDDSRSSDKTDVVYQGTERIDVTLTWTDATAIPGINFYYKAANSPQGQFTLLGPLESGQTASIFLRMGMADMPHQVSLSRWKFKLEAFDPQTQAMPMRAYRAMGDVNVEMKIFNGGDQFIDPPHPYFFTEGPTRFAGEVNKTFTNCVYVNNTRLHESQPSTEAVAYGCKLDGFSPAMGNIVPWETSKVVLELWYNYTSPGGAGPRSMGLKFHASDTSAYTYPKAVESKAGYARYEIEVTEAMTDSPYARESDWQFGVYPIVQDQRDLGSEISGDVHILSTAISDGAQGRGMGN